MEERDRSNTYLKKTLALFRAGPIEDQQLKYRPVHIFLWSSGGLHIILFPEKHRELSVQLYSLPQAAWGCY